MKKGLLFVVVALIASMAVFGCEKAQMKETIEGAVGDAMDTAPEMGVESPAPNLPATVATIVLDANGKKNCFDVWVATTDAERMTGLMNRESLPEEGGMWFVMSEGQCDNPSGENCNFWMKDTEIPLDVIFVSKEMKVASIFPDAVPGSLDMIASDAPYQYVLEINGGMAAEMGLKAGDAVTKQIGHDGCSE